MNRQYSSLIFIVIFSVLITVFTTFQLMEPILHYFIPPYKNCYQALQKINNLDNKLFLIFQFYISFLVMYFLIFSFLLFKILIHKKMQNIYITIMILTLFNASIMSLVIYIDLEFKKSSIWWCDFERQSCESAYKVIHNIETNTSFTPTVKEIKPCLLNYKTYTEKTIQILKERKQ